MGRRRRPGIRRDVSSKATARTMLVKLWINKFGQRSALSARQLVGLCEELEIIEIPLLGVYSGLPAWPESAHNEFQKLRFQMRRLSDNVNNAEVEADGTQYVIVSVGAGERRGYRLVKKADLVVPGEDLTVGGEVEP